LPLYPQYSSTTTGSSLNEWRRLWTGAVPTSCVAPFYRNPIYIAAVVERIDEAIARFPHPEAVPLVFSAHSVPVSVIEKGDPYQRQIEETVDLVMEQGGQLSGAVSLSIANHSASLPVAYRLYLPKDWADDKARRGKAGVPSDIRFKTKPEIALEQVRWACEAGLPRGVALMDAAYGTDSR